MASGKRVENVGGPTPQQRLDAPGAHEQELDAKVHVFRSGKHPTLLEEMVRENPDPFVELYENHILNPETGEVDHKKSEVFLKAHQIDEYLEARAAQRERLLAKQETEYADGGMGPVPFEKQEELLISHALEVEDDRAGVVET